ncbi:probable RNA-directed DNA polymerase from transposon X-element [Trichonephila clavipes]|nr:probable RNA-directed DNA polymerase from transposon X-element [Trichonephila clavipes]
MSAPRTDVASSIKVGDLFTFEPLSFDAIAANDYMDKCTTCIESEELCDVLEEILVTLDDPDMPNTPERLRLVNSVQWTALKCSRKSIRLQNKEFKDYIRDIERLNRQADAVEETGEIGRKLPSTSTSPRHIEGAESSMEEGETSAEESSDEVSSKPVKPVIAPRSPAAKAAGSASAPGISEKDDGFTFVGRNGRRIAPIVIDSQSNATELLDQLGKFCDTPLEGRFENGKLRVFPASAEEHRLIQKYISDKKLRSHTFEMAHNKQLKVVLRGLPTDFNQEELMTELHTFGFQPNHISLLRNRKTNTNMPLFLVTLPKSPESRGIFNIKTIGFFRVAVEPLNKSTMPPQCYRCQEFFHHSRFCARAPKCLKCSGGHLTSDCTKSAKAPAKCANCSGPHPANFSGCPRNPINTKTNKSKSTKNVWQERAAARKENKKQPTTPSFAEVVKKGTNNSLDAKEVMNQMAQMMSKPPHGSINTTELDAILIHSNKAFLFGDFNARHPSWNPGRANSNGNILCNWAVGSALDILAPDTPTHFNSRHSNAILDIGFAVNLSHTEVFTINTLSSDHNPVIFDFVTNNALPPILRTLKTTNWIKFQEIISHTIPGNPRIDDLDLAVQNFTSNISNAISASTSTRLITTPHLRLPENIRELIRAKNRFRKLWNETRYPPYKREVNALIRQIRKEIQEHKNRTWKDFLLTLNPEDNSLYNLHRKFSKRHIPLPPLHGPGGMAYSDFEKAEVFKDTLEVTFQENEEPYCDDKIEEVESLVDDFFDNFTTCTPPLTSPSEVRGIIKKLQNRKAAGPDQIPNIAFKYFTQNVLTHLTKLYNQCLIKNHFPTLWKQANVIMLAKPNQDRTYPQGYRPISLINATAKIFERIILTRIKSHCKAIDCIPPEQCGFREGHSTLHQLIRVTNFINEGFAHKLYTVGVFLDVKRAFDKLWHDGLTYKLIKLQFPDYLIKIIHNFLHNRTFRVRVNNSYSNTGSCLSGVPQGSVLSPYLYNIYTHDFPQHSTVSTCLFADDSAVLSQGVQLKYTIKNIQHFLDKLETWLTHWRIAINVDKTQAIVFRKWGVIDPPFQLTLFDDYIQWVPVVKYLGLHIDSRLTFKKHIDYLSEKFWGRISLAISLVGRRSPLSLENKVILYKQILRPVITYGSPVWGAAAATHMKKYK